MTELFREKEPMQKEAVRNNDWPDFVEYDERTAPTDGARDAQEKFLCNKFRLTREDARDVIDYKNSLNFSFPELVDKKILDIGSGAGGFKQGLLKMGYKAREIVSLDRFYAAEPQNQRLDVQALAEFLPLKDESFDIAVANCSVPVMAASDGALDLIPMIFKEMVRVVKKGGEIRLFPAGGFRTAFDDETNKKRATLGKIMRKELEKLHKKSPETKIRISKVREPKDSESFMYSLEIQK